MVYIKYITNYDSEYIYKTTDDYTGEKIVYPTQDKEFSPTAWNDEDVTEYDDDITQYDIEFLIYDELFVEML